MDVLERGKKIRETQHALMRAFVGWRIWWGPACGSWWALSPNHSAPQVLIEASDPETLVAKIRWFLS